MKFSPVSDTIRLIISVAIMLLLLLLLPQCGGSNESECMICSEECQELCMAESETIRWMQGEVDRRTDVYLPPVHYYLDGLPVIIDLHGFNSSGEDQRGYTEFVPIARKHNVIVVWPWSKWGEACKLGEGWKWNSELREGPDDVAYIDALIDTLFSRYAVDLTRIYVTGLSDGAFMTNTLGCELSDRIAAIAPVAGTISDAMLAQCNPTRPIPVLQVYGTADQVIPWEGDANCGIASVDRMVEFWTQNSGCLGDPVMTEYPDHHTGDDSKPEMYSYTCSSSNVQLLKIVGGGHNWPGSQTMLANNWSVTLPINQDVHASELIWEFFSQHQVN